MNENSIEKNQEKIPTKKEILEVISRFAKDITITNVVPDDKGIFLLEARTAGEKPNEFTEYRYVRKGKFPQYSESIDTSICVAYYVNGEAISGYPVAIFNPETGEWK